MNMLKKLFAIALSAGMLAFAGSAAAQEAPDALVKRISQEVLDTAKADPEIQKGNPQRVQELVESKILPYVNFERMTASAVGRGWREATPEQRKQLVTEFRTLLIHTYSGAISQIKDQRLQFSPLRADSDKDVEVQSRVVQSRGEPIQLSYRLAKEESGWKIYDINVLGAWLVQTYRGDFASEINKGGIDGLIKSLTERNKRLAGNSAKAAK